ncbi:PAS domain S-box protein [Novosphingobium sp. P6W]|uniref:PAS domain S-box protein n=1 Tax=Novosphingobium sp. P6W TaxID=1609758 RepID=UPI0005C30BA5|nr:PAS domain S-box protein [Novosphingobium sp. P6W]AXB76037.1 PAS domain S-box protein [Novosphingobium sp. P6W]KIS31223.1 histidine kinase [Novosphingobium sp. P6W]
MTRSEDNDTGVMGLSGDLARRIAAHDWAATALGPIANWPVSLRHTVRMMLPSPVPLVLLWGSEGVMLYNDAYSKLAGGRDSRLLGSNVLDGWDEVADFNANVMRVGLSGGSLSYRDHALTLHRDGHPEEVRLNLDYSPVPGDDGKPAGVIAIVVETTQTYKAREVLEESETRLRFLDTLSGAVADCRGADQILEITTRLTAQHLGLSNCAYADMDEAGDGFTIRGNWHAAGSPSIVGHYRLSDFGTLAVRELNAGQALVINDNAAELLPEEARTFQSIGIAATICVPLVKEGRLTALMAIHDSSPHRWSDYELSVIREVTERSWAHVQRVGAEVLLREHEEYNRQILDGATDYGIVATDLRGNITLWNAGAKVMLGWTEAEVLGQPIDLLFTAEDRGAGRPAAKRHEALETGRAHDARWHVRKSGEHFWGLGEMTPLRDNSGAVIGFVKLLRDRTHEHEAQEALRLSEDQLRRAQVAGGIGLFSVDIAANTITGTDELCRIFGVEQQGVFAPEIFENMVVPEDRERTSNLSKRHGGAALLDVEYRIHRADTGEERILARKADFELDDAGNPVRMVGVVQDVTERYRTQRALEKSEAQFSMLAQNMPTQVWTARADGRMDWFNDRAYAYAGEQRGSFEEDGWARIVHPDERGAVLERWARSVATGEVYDTEMRLRDAAGRYRWHLVRALPLTDARGAIAAWVGTNTEIEAQKQAEAAFAQDRDRLWTITRDLMLVCDFTGTITAVNPSAERLLGWHEGEMLGRRIATFIHPEDLEVTAAEVAKLSTGKRTVAFENRYRARDGDYRLLAWTAVPDEQRIHAIGRDITDQRAVEEALRQSQKMEAVGQLTGGIAHDFNNLLQGITGSLDVMHNRLAQGRTGDLDRWLTGARASAERAAALTHRLLAFSRRQPLDPRPVRPNPLVASMEDMLRRTLGEHIELEFVLAGGLWLTQCDPHQLESAILNLVINARDAMPGGGRLTIETCNAHLDGHYAARQRDVKPGQYVCIAITDTGVGMSRETAARAFEPFFTTKPIGQGTGLGLSMIYGFARQSEGYARIYSEEGIGSTIKLYLPRHHGAESTPDEPALQDSLPIARQGEVVLVVEDEPVVRGLILEVLDELGYQAIEASDGPAGLAILQSRRRIDLLITDIGLPGLNGRQVADGGRASRPGLKVLFMTGYAENAAMASGFLEPGMAMITKPFAIDMLAGRIREIIEG